LRCHDMLHVWFPVYNPKYSSYSPGRILFKHILVVAAQHGIRLFDRGEGDTQAKREFSNEEHIFSYGLWHVAGWRGLRARIVLSAFWRIS